MYSSILSAFFVFLPAVFRYGYVSTRNGQSRNFCVFEEPFAMIISGGYARVGLTMYYYYRTTLKALYFVMNNTGLDGKLTARLTIYHEY